MLGLRGDDVLLAPLVEPGHALDRHVVRLRRARRENDLRGRPIGRSVVQSIVSVGKRFISSVDRWAIRSTGKQFISRVFAIHQHSVGLENMQVLS